MIPLSATAVGKRYRSHWAVRDCTFALPEGKVIALVGPNGAGKSTLLRMAAGLARPSTGQLEVFGNPVHGRTHPDVSFMDQDRPLYGDLTVREMVRVTAGMNDRWSAERVQEVLALQAGVDQGAKIRTLSAGTRTQRQATLLLKDSGPAPQGWTDAEPDLESLVMGYLRASRARSSASRG